MNLLNVNIIVIIIIILILIGTRTGKACQDASHCTAWPGRLSGRTRAQAVRKPESSSTAKRTFRTGVSRGTSM